MPLNSLAEKFFSEFSSDEKPGPQLSFRFPKRQIDDAQYERIEVEFGLSRAEAEGFFDKWCSFHDFYQFFRAIKAVPNGMNSQINKEGRRKTEAYITLLNACKMHSYEAIIGMMMEKNFDGLDALVGEKEQAIYLN